MNAITSGILWMSVQVFLFSLVGLAAFAILRRRGPGTAVACAATVLGLTLTLVLLLGSPWPRWIGTGQGQATLANVNSTAQTGGQDAVMTAGESTTTESHGALAAVTKWWQTFMQSLEPSEAAADGHNFIGEAWQTWIVWLLAAGIGVGLLRLAAGVWAVGKLRRRSQPIANSEMETLVRELGERLDAPAVELRETSLLRSAATVGWRRPVLLLPMDWQSWDETERRVVLAHELAHVARQDYLTGLLARFVAAIHFYQPLVLWLGRQLRIQQELAADSEAAAVAGNRQTYLATLAQMALRADEQPLPWAARAFLPGTSMLIKRVAWLKRKGLKMEKSLGRSGRWLLVAAMAAVVLAVAGIRGPRDSFSPVAMAAPPEEDAKPQAGNQPAGPGAGTLSFTGLQLNQLRTTRFVPADAKLVVGVDPREIAKIAPGSKPVVDMLDKEFQTKNGFKLTDVVDFELIWTTSTQQPNLMVIQSEKPVGWKETLQRKNPDDMEIKHLGEHEYYVLKDSPDFGPCAYMVDDRTIVAGSEEEIQKVIQGSVKPMDAKEFPEFLVSPLAIRMEMPFVKRMAGLENLPKDFEANPFTAMFLPLIQQVKQGRAFIEPIAPGAKSVGFQAVIECDSADGAQQVGKTLDALRTVGLNLVQAKMQAWRQTGQQAASKEEAEHINQLFDMLTKALSDVKVSADGSTVHAAANVELGPALVAGFMMPAMAKAKEAELRKQSMVNMKYLGLAMYLFNDKNQHFPPPAIRGTDGKPLLSWRVAILPFMDKNGTELYKEFHLEEPWDSEHNKALLAKMPAVFRDPHEPEGSNNSSYFMPTGKGTIGGNENGTEVKDIHRPPDTVMLVDAKRDIPWTKPEDIEIDADPAKPLPKFGGHMPDGLFAATFADGHVQPISNDADPKVLHAIFTINSGEPVSMGELLPSHPKKLPQELKKVEPPASPAPSSSPAVPKDSSGMNRAKIEFRLAEAEPGEGLTEVALPGDGPERIYLHSHVELSNEDVAEANVITDNNNGPAVSVTLTDDGAKKMETLSQANRSKTLAIVVDGKVLMAPKIQSTISKKVQISGHFNQEEAEKLTKEISGN